MNLTERLGREHRLWCPFSESKTCTFTTFLDGLDETVQKPTDCAHYNPETDECFHVEAARAQVEAARALRELAETIGMAYDRTPELMRRFVGDDRDA